MNDSLSNNEQKTEKPPKKIGIVMRHAPYGNNLAHEALDAALAASLYGQELSLIFMGDGVFQLLHQQQSAAINQKNIEKQLSALELYDIEKIFVCNNSLKQRRLKIDKLAINAEAIEQEALQQLLHAQDALLSF